MSSSVRLSTLVKTGRTVFTAKDLKLFWDVKATSFPHIIKRMADKGLLERISKGIYAVSGDFNRLEAANAILSPSYVSLHSALVYHSVAFQHSETVTSVSYCNYQKKAGGMTYRYYTVKDDLLFDLSGIVTKAHFSIASPERAILDSFYLGMLPNIDNPEPVNKTFLKILSTKYPQSVQKKIKPLVQ